MMTSIANAGGYLRPTQAYSSRTLTTADALQEADPNAGAAAGTAKQGIPVSAVKAIDISQLKVISVKDNPELRDRMAEAWLRIKPPDRPLLPTCPTMPRKTPMRPSRLNGKIVATLYNGGSVAMTNQAAAMVGDLQDPPGLNGGPDLAQWRAERIAKAVGGTVEKASTAITQSAWKPRQTISTSYARAIGCGLRRHDGRTTEGHRAELCGLFNSARVLRRLHRLQRLMLFNAPLMAA